MHAELGITPEESRTRITQHIKSVTMTIVCVVVCCTVIEQSVIHPGTGIDIMSACTIHDLTHVRKCTLKCLI